MEPIAKPVVSMTNEELAAAIQAGERAKLLELWEQVERFVRWKARKMVKKLEDRHDLTVEDLCQCGFLGLVTAADTFSAAGGGNFLTWLDFHLKKEFAIFGGWRTERQKSEPLRHALSLDAPVTTDDEASALGDLIDDPSAEEALLMVEERDRLERLRNAVETALQTLPEPQQEVIRARFFWDQTPTDTAAAMGQSMDQVRRLESKAIRALRHPRISRELQRHWE